MSGGLDSTPIAALAARHLAQRGGRPAVTALSWRVSDPRGDESELIRRMADQRRHRGRVDRLRRRGAVLEPRRLARPPSDSRADRLSLVPSAQLRPRRRARAPVVLSGFCGDALYANARNWAWDLLDAEGPGRTIDRLREVAAEIGWRRTLRSHLFGPLLPRRRESAPGAARLPDAGARQTARSRPQLAARRSTAARRPRQAERVLALLDAHGANVERFYTEPFGLEQRTPLRDFDLVQFMLAVPDHLLQQGTETRPVLRAAVRGLVPEEIRLRRGKAAFHDVLRSRPRHGATALGAGASCSIPTPSGAGFIEESAIRAWVEETPADRGEQDRLPARDLRRALATPAGGPAAGPSPDTVA